MEHARKMVIIPEDAADRVYSSVAQDGHGARSLQPPPPPPPPAAAATVSNPTDASQILDSIKTPGDEFSRLDDEMSRILNSNDFQDNREKWKIFFQTLQRYLFFIQKSRIKPADFPNTNFSQDTGNNDAEEQNDRMSMKNIVATVPKKYTDKAQKLLNYLKLNTTSNRFFLG